MEQFAAQIARVKVVNVFQVNVGVGVMVPLVQPMQLVKVIFVLLEYALH